MPSHRPVTPRDVDEPVSTPSIGGLGPRKDLGVDQHRGRAT
jgi:hypothetical protein